MENNTLSKRTAGFGVALAIACVVNALIVVAKEKNEAVMNGMKKIAGHHWTTHSLIVLAIFLGGGALLSARAKSNANAGSLIKVIASAVGAACLIIVYFYLFVD